MKALKNIAIGFFIAYMSIGNLIGSVILFVEIFDSQSFMAILRFALSLICLAISLLFTCVIGMYINGDNEKVVKCKDCTEWDAKECECYHWHGFKENDYCSHGIRKGAE